MTSKLFGDQLYQAAEKVAAQLDCTGTRPSTGIIIRAAATGVTSAALALDIINRVIHCDP
jgi:hypothetical protein